jgi:hypothetical protein
MTWVQAMASPPRRECRTRSAQASGLPKSRRGSMSPNLAMLPARDRSSSPNRTPEEAKDRIFRRPERDFATFVSLG